VNRASRKLASPTESDYLLVKRIFRYLQGSKLLKLFYFKSSPDIIGYSDADFANDPDRKSVSGYVFKMNGGPISWKSKKQNIVALSSTEAEYIALSEATQEALWLRKLRRDLRLPDIPITIYEDNQPTIHTANDYVRSQRTKHIDTKYHFTREQVMAKNIDLIYCPTNDMTADIFTKPLARIQFQKHVKGLNLKL
jgi:hypothetical protein